MRYINRGRFIALNGGIASVDPEINNTLVQRTRAQRAGGGAGPVVPEGYNALELYDIVYVETSVSPYTFPIGNYVYSATDFANGRIKVTLPADKDVTKMSIYAESAYFSLTNVTAANFIHVDLSKSGVEYGLNEFDIVLYQYNGVLETAVFDFELHLFDRVYI